MCSLQILVLLLLLYCLDEEQALIQSNESSNANARKNCRNLIQKRAHTIDDFMTGNPTTIMNNT